MNTGTKTHQQAPKPMEQAPKPMDLDAMTAAALRRLASLINRSAAQHLRAMRKTYPSPQ